MLWLSSFVKARKHTVTCFHGASSWVSGFWNSLIIKPCYSNERNTTGFLSFSICVTGTVVAQASITVVIASRVSPLTCQAVCLQKEKTFITSCIVKDQGILVTFLQKMRGGQTSALLMNCSIAFFSFSLCPLQALSADACRARPKENVRIQGLARGQLLMALRWRVASSSLWPPERKAIPVGGRQHNSYLVSVKIYTCLYGLLSRSDSHLAYLGPLGGQCAVWLWELP